MLKAKQGGKDREKKPTNEILSLKMLVTGLKTQSQPYEGNVKFLFLCDLKFSYYKNFETVSGKKLEFSSFLVFFVMSVSRYSQNLLKKLFNLVEN